MIPKSYLDSILVYHEEDQKTLDIPKQKYSLGDQ